MLNEFFSGGGGSGGDYQIERSVRFNGGDSASLSQSVSGSTTTYTASMWLKHSAVGNGQYELFFFSGGGNGCGIGFDPADKITVYNNAHNPTDAVYRDPSAWYHILLSVNSGTATLYVNGAVAKSGVTGFEWSNTATIGRYNISATNYFNGYIADVYLVDGQALTPSSFTETDANGIIQPVAYSGSYGTRGFHLDFSDNSTDAALGTDASGNGNDWTVNSVTASAPTVLFGEDVNEVSFDNNSTSLTLDTTGYSYSVLTGSPYQVSGQAEIARVIKSSDGSSFTATFTTTSSQRYIWTSSNGINWSSPGIEYETSTTPAVITAAWIAWSGGSNAPTTSVEFNAPKDVDSLFDSPTNGTQTDTGAGGEVSGNYATYNALFKAANSIYSNGNLEHLSATPGGSYESGVSTIGVSSGKWYAEFTVAALGSDAIAGVSTAPYNILNSWPGFINDSIGYEAVLGQFYKDGVGGQNVSTYNVNDVIGVALDLDNGGIWFSKNGTWQGTGGPNPATNTSPAYTGLTGTHFFASGTGGSGRIIANFGQRPFAYAAPSGFKALCTANLPDPTIADGSTAMDVVTYTGNGSTQTISGLNFSPDLVWIKNRAQADNHKLLDTVRGATNELESNTADAEVANADGLTAFNSNGFALGADAEYNTNSEAYVAWTWDAGTSTVSNTDGSITSSVRANPSAGFSIVSYTGNGISATTIGHGLGVAPAFIIVKNLDYDGTSFSVYHQELGATKVAFLNSSAAPTTSSFFWNNTDPTSSVIHLNTSLTVNSSGDRHVAYCWAPVEGYSAFGSYTGNGILDGPFVFTNHRPRWILLKRTDTTSDWTIIDTAREGYNVDNDPLYANLTDVEGTADLVDILSNGFKLRANATSVNASAGEYIYASFAEKPFKTARAR